MHTVPTSRSNPTEAPIHWLGDDLLPLVAAHVEAHRFAFALVCTAWRDAVAVVVATERAVRDRHDPMITSRVSAYVSSVALLQWARQQGCLWDRYTCSDAARGGHLHVLQWARQQGCPWDDRTCSNAARGGHLHVLQWARENGCPWDEYTCKLADAGGHMRVLQWARENGCP